MGNRYAKEPLLYIHQPKRKTPEAKMQTDYMTPRKRKQSFAEKIENQRPKRARPIKRGSSSGEWIQAEKEELKEEEKIEEPKVENKEDVEKEHDISKESDHESSGKADSKTNNFDELSIEEKITYLIQKSKLFPVKCELKTEEKTYRGVITQVEDEHVFIQANKRTSSRKVAKKSIHSVRMLGL